MVKYHIPLSKLITLLISNKKEFNHFFKSKSSDIVQLKLDKRATREARDENMRAKQADFLYLECSVLND